MTKKRANGEGSVYRRKDGRVVAEWVDANGKRRYISGKTKTEVKRRLRELLVDREKGIAYDSENLTVGDFLDRWLDSVKVSVNDAAILGHLPRRVGDLGPERLRLVPGAVVDHEVVARSKEVLRHGRPHDPEAYEPDLLRHPHLPDGILTPSRLVHRRHGCPSPQRSPSDRMCASENVKTAAS